MKKVFNLRSKPRQIYKSGEKLKTKMTCDKPDIGCSPFPPRTTSMNPRCWTPCPSSEDSKSSPLTATSTGKSWSPSPRRNLLPKFEESLENAMPNPPEVKQPENMFGKKTRVLRARSSNMELWHAAEMNLLIGRPSNSLLSKATWKKFLPIYMFVATINCGELAKTIYDQWLWSALVQFSGAVPVLESHEELGKKRAWKLTLRIQTASFGTVTEITNMWSSMNFEVQSAYPICCDGLTDIHVSLKLKDRQSCFAQPKSGSPRI